MKKMKCRKCGKIEGTILLTIELLYCNEHMKIAIEKTVKELLGL